jgi:hypothetical protein
MQKSRSSCAGGSLDSEKFDNIPGGLPLGDVKAGPLMTVCNYQFLGDLSFIRQPEDVFDVHKQQERLTYSFLMR